MAETWIVVNHPRQKKPAYSLTASQFQLYRRLANANHATKDKSKKANTQLMVTTHQAGLVNRSSADCQKQRRTLRQTRTAEVVVSTLAMNSEEHDPQITQSRPRKE
jgi:hypothetical protein